MSCFNPIRFVARVALALALATATAGVAQDKDQPQHKKPLPLKPDLPGMATNHRLILKDGNYQIVRRYEIVGDRVRYISLERGGEWEELPVDLVDWEATRKWERDHANQAVEGASPAMKEAEEIDKEEAAERAELQARRPEVAKGLELPDEDGVFALDTFQGTPELVELVPVDLALNAKNKHGLSTLNPLAGAKASLELDGQHAKIHLHVNDPAIYLALASSDEAEKVLSHAVTVETKGAKEVANRKHGAHSPASGFAIVRVDERKAVRIVGGVHVSPTGSVTQDENVIPAKVEVMPGKHWLKITPKDPLAIGEYALVEILSASDINQSVWDFRVDPQLGDNEGSMGPIFK
jgi:flagellar motor protein MotB